MWMNEVWTGGIVYITHYQHEYSVLKTVLTSSIRFQTQRALSLP